MRSRKAGSTTVEFALVGIPVIFLIMSTFEIARAMWVYQTIGHATHTVTRHVAVHGASCGGTNSCLMTVGGFALDYAKEASGMDPNKLVVTFYSQGTSVACNPLKNCNSNSTTWPPVADNTVGNDVRIAASIPFATPLRMFWPGVVPVNFSAITFTGYSRQRILF